MRKRIQFDRAVSTLLAERAVLIHQDLRWKLNACMEMLEDVDELRVTLWDFISGDYE